LNFFGNRRILEIQVVISKEGELDMVDEKQTNDFYKREIKNILKQVERSLKKEQIYNYELFEQYTEVENDFKDIQNNNILANNILGVYENAKKLLNA
jgi:hypothetical protein